MPWARSATSPPLKPRPSRPAPLIEGIGVVEQVGAIKPQLQRVFVRPGNVEIPVPDAQMVSGRRCECRASSARIRASRSVSAAASRCSPRRCCSSTCRSARCRSRSIRCAASQPLEPVRVTVRFTGDPRVLAQIGAGDRDFGDVRNELSATRHDRQRRSGGRRVARGQAHGPGAARRRYLALQQCAVAIGQRVHAAQPAI